MHTTERMDTAGHIGTAGRLLHLYVQRGALCYEGEGITQLQHAWQCGQLARRAGAGPALQLAAWLHDVGHLMTDLPGSPTVDGIDDAHEQRAAAVLAPLFGPAVAEPVALHVQAKRYLVGTRRDYRARLSPDSIRSLALQGGAMDEDEAGLFLGLPFAEEALRLRAWDDAGKVQELPWVASEALAALAALMEEVRRR